MFLYRINKILKHWPFALIIIAYILFSLSYFNKIGVNQNEIAFYENGVSFINHVINTVFSVDSYKLFNQETINSIDQLQNYNYPLYSSVLIIFNVFKNFDVFHLINAILFSSIIFISYLLIYKKYKNPLLAALGPFFILIQPRLIGHIFNTPQNISFSIFFFLSLSGLYIFSKLQSRTSHLASIKVITLGVLFGITQSINILGYALYIIVFINFFHSFIFKPTKKVSSILNFLLEFLLVAGIAHLIMLGTWPYIAVNPIPRVISLFNIWVGDLQPILFLGINQTVPTLTYHAALALHTIPVPLLILLTLGVYYFFKKLRDDLFFLFSSTLILFAVIFWIFDIKYAQGIESVLFLLPVIGIVAAIIFIEIVLDAKDESLQSIFVLIVFASMINVVKDIIELHPYQYTYYNEISGGRNLGEKLFGGDYLDLSYKEASDFVKKTFEVNTDVYVCGQKNIVEYYSQNKFSVVESPENAHILMCKEEVFGIEPYEIISRKGLELNYIYKVNTDY